MVSPIFIFYFVREEMHKKEIFVTKKDIFSRIEKSCRKNALNLKLRKRCQNAAEQLV